ncbi:hypothetical protein N658DRAFT_50987 [Parathielavia hyrcaniae]|uniref:Uncharacterized protein n=1 Tax=Parathielavia hyrcaniae TaxID=113614 RepID=A0AAN6T2H6_9PEZI|nr:hypothetical protein N658DRAFT_50987 [Parathielavia hyrcaniae]
MIAKKPKRPLIAPGLDKARRPPRHLQVLSQVRQPLAIRSGSLLDRPFQKQPFAALQIGALICCSSTLLLSVGNGHDQHTHKAVSAVSAHPPCAWRYSAELHDAPSTGVLGARHHLDTEKWRPFPDWAMVVCLGGHAASLGVRVRGVCPSTSTRGYFVRRSMVYLPTRSLFPSRYFKMVRLATPLTVPFVKPASIPEVELQTWEFPSPSNQLLLVSRSRSFTPEVFVSRPDACRASWVVRSVRQSWSHNNS